MIYIIPLEPLEERYTKQWYRWFENAFPDAQFIDGEPLTDKITKGNFLDVCGTNYYKATQLQEICFLIHTGVIKAGDTLFFMDLWFPGLEMLEYMRKGTSIDFKIVGCLHAGTYDPHDFLTQQGMAGFGRMLENCWFHFVDRMFVATRYHSQLVQQNRRIIPEKIKVTGFPICRPEKWECEKEDLIVFPHRLHEEKNPQLFDDLTDKLAELLPDWKCARTMDSWSGSKSKYYMQLSKAKFAVSFADQETWGIAMQEALFLDCIPIVPDRLSYPEMYDKQFLFNGGVEEAAETIMRHIGTPPSIESNKQRLLKEGKIALKNMREEIWKIK